MFYPMLPWWQPWSRDLDRLYKIPRRFHIKFGLHFAKWFWRRRALTMVDDGRTDARVLACYISSCEPNVSVSSNGKKTIELHDRETNSVVIVLIKDSDQP